MSKERARRREEREREAAARAAARAAETERAERRAARRAAVVSPFARLVPDAVRPAPGIIAQRRRRRTGGLLAGLLALNLLAWLGFERPMLSAAAAMLSVLAAPVLYVLLFPRP